MYDFTKFIEETIEKWHEFEDSHFEKGNLLRELDKAIREVKKATADMSSTDKGNIGERFVKNSIQKKGYDVELSPQSLSPADVWGQKYIDDNFYHLSLIQVKATQSEEEPEKLDNTAVKELELFSAFVFKCLHESKQVKEDLKKFPIIVSVGYAGVVLDDNHEPSLHKNGIFYYATYSRTIEKQIDEYMKIVMKFHTLK